MNILLTAANGAFAYYRGRQTGLWGLVGIAVALIMAFNWDYIQPVLEWLGVVAFFEKLGLVVPDDPGMTGFKIMMFIVTMCFLCMLLGGILLILCAFLIAFAQTKIGSKLAIIGFILLFIPIAIIIFMYQIIADKMRNKNEPMKKYVQLGKNGLVIDFLKNHEIAPLVNSEPTYQQVLMDQNEDFRKSVEENRRKTIQNEVPVERALASLNRLPMLNDANFLVGMTEDHDFYMVLPRPLQLDTPKFKKGYFICYPLSISELNKKFNREFNVNGPAYINVMLDRKNPINIGINDITCFFSPYRFQDIKEEFNKFVLYPDYTEYVEMVQNVYFDQKMKIRELMETCSTEEYPILGEQLYNMTVGNEDVATLFQNK